MYSQGQQYQNDNPSSSPTNNTAIYVVVVIIIVALVGGYLYITGVPVHGIKISRPGRLVIQELEVFDTTGKNIVLGGSPSSSSGDASAAINGLKNTHYIAGSDFMSVHKNGTMHWLVVMFKTPVKHSNISKIILHDRKGNWGPESNWLRNMKNSTVELIVPKPRLEGISKKLIKTSWKIDTGEKPVHTSTISKFEILV